MAAVSIPPPIDPVATYLDEIGRYRLLTVDEERRLAARISAGQRARRKLKEAPPADPVERRELERTVAEGATAFERFVNANLRLVVSVAKRYQGTGVPLLDLVQDGNLGLIRAVEKFDHTKGFRFSTYGVWWIRQFISRGLAGTRSSARLPTRANDDLQRLRRGADALGRDGRTPTQDELAEFCGLPVERVAELTPFLSEPVSLNASIGDGDSELADMVADPEAASVIEAVGDRLTSSEVGRLLAPLDDRERTIIELRYGFGGGEPLSTAEIATHIGLSRERVRQLEHRATSKLTHPSRSSLWKFVRGC